MMEPETIHVHRQNNFEKTRLLLLMVPCIVFIVVLLAYLVLSSYPSHSAANYSQSNVLGTGQK